MWFEEKMVTGVKNYVSDVTMVNADFLFRGGLEQSPGLLGSSAARRHGYGAASFIRYLARDDEQRVGRIIRRSKDSSGLIFTDFLYLPVEAIERELNVWDSVGERWWRFARSMLKGECSPT